MAIGCWVGVGARDETPELAGVSHFLEHLLFKGTPTLSATELAQEVEAAGGEMNAYTGAETTAFFVRLPADALDLGLELLAEVVRQPAFGPADVEAERQVILEELVAAQDDGEDRAHELLNEALFPEHPLGREIMGGRESIEAMDTASIAGFHDRWYRPDNLVWSVVGPVDHDRVASVLDARFVGAPAGVAPVRQAPAVLPLPGRAESMAIEQAHVAVGLRALANGDDDRFALSVASQVLGGGTASRLFQRVREERGLAYTVYSQPTSYRDCGTLVLYAGTSPDCVDEVLATFTDELDRLAGEPIAPRELEVAVGYLVGSMLIGLEDLGSRMNRLASSLASYGRVVPIDETVDRYRAVSAEDVQRVMQRVAVDQPRSVVTVAPGRSRTSRRRRD